MAPKRKVGAATSVAASSCSVYEKGLNGIDEDPGACKKQRSQSMRRDLEQKVERPMVRFQHIPQSVLEHKQIEDPLERPGCLPDLPLAPRPASRERARGLGQGHSDQDFRGPGPEDICLPESSAEQEGAGLMCL